MAFTEVMFIYGVPKPVMGAGENAIFGDKCSSVSPCVCRSCKCDLARIDPKAYVYPCCSKVDVYIYGTKIGSCPKSGLEVENEFLFERLETGEVKLLECIEKPYLSVHSARVNLDEIFNTLVAIPECPLPIWAHCGWGPEDKPQVYLVPDECILCPDEP